MKSFHSLQTLLSSACQPVFNAEFRNLIWNIVFNDGETDSTYSIYVTDLIQVLTGGRELGVLESGVGEGREVEWVMGGGEHPGTQARHCHLVSQSDIAP